MTDAGKPARGQQTTDVDCRGLQCPLPVIETQKALSDLSAGDLMRVICTDPAAEIDLKVFCARAGHRLDRIDRRQDEIHVWILKGVG